MLKHRFTQITIAIVTFGLVFWLSAGPGATEPKKTRSLPKVRTAKVSQSSAETEIRFSGVLRARQRATLSFAISGRMSQRLVNTGERVEAGQVVALLDPQPFDHALSSARAQVAELGARKDQAARDLKRVRELLASKAATREEFEKVSAALASLEASFTMAETATEEALRLKKEAVLRAPFSGFVTGVSLEAGEFAGSGAPIVNVSGSGHLELEVEVQESMLSHLNSGSRVALRLPFSDNREIWGAIRVTGPSSGSPGKLFPVIVDIEPGKDLIPGMTAELILPLHTREALAIPVGAVVNPGGSNPGVWRVRDGLVEKVPVAIGQLVDELVTIQGNLISGDHVVTGGFSGLVDGEQVEVVQ